MNNKLPEWRKTLNKSVENYQSMRAWYEENPDNPSAEQDMDAAAGEIEKLIRQHGVLIVLNLLDEIDELQERRRTDNQEPAPERERIRREHAEWSDATFGDVGPIGPLKHLSKEALEAAADPSDPLEWADMQFLLWDAQRRMGISDEFITRAMIEKLAINKARQWPEPKDGEPRQHIKELPAPVKQPSNAEQVADLYALCWKPGDVVTYTPDPEKATIWLNNYSGTSVQEYVNLELLQEDTKHGLLEVAIARFSKMNEGFPIKRFKADWVISWMLENFPPVAQKQGDN